MRPRSPHLPLLFAGLLLAGCPSRSFDPGRHDNYHPAWSPDGTRIAFDRYYKDGDGRYFRGHIFVVDADGGRLVQLTAEAAWDGHPTYSPDGARIFFESDRDAEDVLYAVPAAGGEIEKIAVIGSGGFVSLSPDGSRVLYYSNRDGNADIYVHDLARRFDTKLTDNTYPDYNPSWHPDGASIVFHSVIDGKGIPRLMRADGTGTRTLIDGWGEDATFSPDGSRIAFNSDRDGDWEVLTANADGDDVRQVTHGESRDFSPAWSPDGGRLAFVSDRTGRHEIFVINVDGTGLMQLTGTGGSTE